MSMYRCNICEELKDNDYEICYEHNNGLCCESCQCELEDEDEYE